MSGSEITKIAAANSSNSISSRALNPKSPSINNLSSLGEANSKQKKHVKKLPEESLTEAECLKELQRICKELGL